MATDPETTKTPFGRSIFASPSDSSPGGSAGTNEQPGLTGFYESFFDFGAANPAQNGVNPNANLILDAAGNLYGTANFGGSGNIGTVFEAADSSTSLRPISAVTSFSNYKTPAGASLSPGNLVMDSSGNLFGTTQTGGTTAAGRGTVFELKKTATGYEADPSVLTTFKQGGATGPENLILDSTGNLFGTTTSGPGGRGYGGTVFEVAKTAKGYAAGRTVLANFKGNEHISSNLVTDSSGNLYGAVSGGQADTGEIFELRKTATGRFARQPTILARNVNATNLTTDSAGDLIGLSATGGLGGGDIFKMTKTASGFNQPQELTIFGRGSQPTGMTLDSSGNIYGTTRHGGIYDDGTVFELQTQASSPTGYSGAARTVVSFGGNTGDYAGDRPVGSPVIAANGFLYGTTQHGGPYDYGYLYGIDLAAYNNAGTGQTAVATNDAAVALCFTTGTRIATSRGEVAVEDLRIGDRAVTASGRQRPVVWIGHRDLDGAGRPLPHDRQPIRVSAGAFGADAEGQPVPARELRLSPGHPILVGADADNAGGHLVPIMCLVNGTTIVREPADYVTYWHVELDRHDILMAEGLPAESYLDWGDRGFFGEGADDALANPDLVVPGLVGRCRPVAVDGPVVEAARRRLDIVFATRLATACAWPSTQDASLAG